MSLQHFKQLIFNKTKAPKKFTFCKPTKLLFILVANYNLTDNRHEMDIMSCHKCSYFKLNTADKFLQARF